MSAQVLGSTSGGRGRSAGMDLLDMESTFFLGRSKAVECLSIFCGRQRARTSGATKRALKVAGFHTIRRSDSTQDCATARVADW